MEKIDWRITVILATLILCFGINSAQAQFTWARTYGGSQFDTATSVQTTSDGGSVVVGTTKSFSMSGDIWLLKLDSAGNIQWQKTYDSSGDDRAKSIQVTLDNGYVVLGDSFFIGQPGLWILRLDPSGNVLWQKNYGGTGIEFGGSIQLTQDGGFVVTSTSATQSFDVWVLKLDADGDIEWQKAYGGPGNDTGSEIRTTSDGGFIVGGQTESFGAGGTDFWVLKLDPDGNVQWQKTFGGASFDQVNSVRMTSDEGFIVAGATDSFGAGFNDIWILKLDPTGNIQWQKTYGGSASERAEIRTTSDGGFIVAGQTASFGAGLLDFWVFKLNSAGNIQWQKTYGGIGFEVFTTVIASSGGFLIGGSTDSFGAANSDAWVLKLDASGDIDSSCLLNADTTVFPAISNGVVNDTIVIPIASSAVSIASTAVIQDTTVVSQEQCASQCLFCDDFEDGVMASDWTYGNGGWFELDGELQGSDEGKDTAIASPAFAGCVNCSVTALMSLSNGIGSLVGWHVNKKNFVEVTLKEGSDKLIFKHKANGSLVVKQKVNLTIIPEQMYEVQVSFDGISFKVSVDGTLVLVAQPGIVPFGTVGFQIKNGTGKFHEIFVN